MTQFDPTRAPAGRLARLGVVVDPGQPAAAAIARFCDLAGIDVIWLGALEWPLGGSSPAGLAVAPETTAVTPASQTSHPDVHLEHARMGWMIGSESEIPGDAHEIAVVGDAGALAGIARLRDRSVGAVRMSVVANAAADVRSLLTIADDIVLPAWRFPDLETAADEARAEAQEAGRDPESLGVAVLLPVSIGRTSTEAEARADRDPLFRRLGHPRDIGIFGTLEECQDRVIALAHAGVTDLRCILPAAPDVHDVIAQLTAVTIGTTDVLVPGSLRSPAPPPPDGWGGRPEQPPRQQVSGGSRRR